MNEVIYSVSELNLMIKGLLEGNRTFTNIQIQGEISNFKRYSSGHCYFTLKDAGGVLKAVMFRNQARSLRFEPQNGDTVVAIGRVGVYERDGVYQLYTDLLLPLGAGDLMLAYEELKKKLTEVGLRGVYDFFKLSFRQLCRFSLGWNSTWFYIGLYRMGDWLRDFRVN